MAERSRRPYQGSSRTKRRRGVIRTRPRPTSQRRRRAARKPVPRGHVWLDGELVYLELPEDAHKGVPCWTGKAARWVHFTVAIAYDLHYDEVRPQMVNGGISKPALLAIAAARARYADHDTGRNCRPTNDQLAEATGFSVRQVQRASEALRLLSVATEILRGRQRTLTERLASWRVGDRGRGWASVWVLHDSAWLAPVINKMSPHLVGSLLTCKSSLLRELTTTKRTPTGARGRGAGRRKSPDKNGSALARSWRAHPGAPPWSRRYSADAWAAMLAAPARHGWTARDLNQLITDWLGITGRRIPDAPHKPIGLLGAILAWHGAENLDDRPAAADEAREAEELAAAAARVARQATELTAPNGPDGGGDGRVAAREAALEAARNAARKRTEDAARQAAQLQEAVRRARGAK
ncbi:helix-turn-helix domain-containing protein [Mycolicibacterium conceptionense]|uniref:helix-turn-helix domain-containing protein n=1 Tax=Mycolicibacterium conceptionense TaxID=451644 RepID=UPI001A978E33|nr:helix-turn-helix domain-containing protein [Mycolicibacterium conceptionense]